MNKLELDDVNSYLHGDEAERQKIVWKYLELYKESIEYKKYDFKQDLKPGEVDSDAVFAIDSCFKEVTAVLDMLKKAEDHLNIKSIFNKHLMRHLRENKQENQPLVQELKERFKGSVRDPIYQGYDTMAHMVPESVLKEKAAIDSPEELVRADMKELLRLLEPDQGTDLYMDLFERYIGGRTLEQISKEPRNKGITKQAVSKRMQNYVARIGEKMKGSEL